eukprot:747175-Hanusia_phi.AAC.10
MHHPRAPPQLTLVDPLQGNDQHLQAEAQSEGSEGRRRMLQGEEGKAGKAVWTEQEHGRRTGGTEQRTGAVREEKWQVNQTSDPNLRHLKIFLTDLFPVPTADAAVCVGHEVTPEPAMAASLEVKRSPLPSNHQRLHERASGRRRGKDRGARRVSKLGLRDARKVAEVLGWGFSFRLLTLCRESEKRRERESQRNVTPSP